MLKHLPNFISALRIFMSPFLLFVAPLSPVFFIIYFLCGLTDVLDGYIARKTHTQSESGARLDTAGDIVYTIIIIILIFKITSLTNLMIIWFAAICTVKLFSILIGLLRFKGFSPIHSYLNKISGITLFLFPIAACFMSMKLEIYIVLALASIAAIDEFLIIAFISGYDANRKAFISKNKGGQ
ncbi:MAG: CDP-alcohol phosphatidyltransferase family protein [Oscillospiraceae bacterium]|jgi:CDP-diacylglycerol--glycerol-3-phosphate 3-phosphatidyltransferase